MPGKILTIALVCLLVGAGAVMFLGPFVNPRAAHSLPPCPYVKDRGFADVPTYLVRAIGAYEAIRETLLRDSLEGIGEQADAIVRAFSDNDPGIASLAKRLAGEKDAESARRAFMRLHRLMQKHSDRLPVPAAAQ